MKLQTTNDSNSNAQLLNSSWYKRLLVSRYNSRKIKCRICRSAARNPFPMRNPSDSFYKFSLNKSVKQWGNQNYTWWSIITILPRFALLEMRPPLQPSVNSLIWENYPQRRKLQLVVREICEVLEKEFQVPSNRIYVVFQEIQVRKTVIPLFLSSSSSSLHPSLPVSLLSSLLFSSLLFFS